MKLVSLKYDVCLKELFQNEAVLKYFLSDVLDIPVLGHRGIMKEEAQREGLQAGLQSGIELAKKVQKLKIMDIKRSIYIT